MAVPRGGVSEDSALILKVLLRISGVRIIPDVSPVIVRVDGRMLEHKIDTWIILDVHPNRKVDELRSRGELVDLSGILLNERDHV